MKAIFDDAGLTHLELEFLMDWFVDPGDERRAASDRAAPPALRRRRRPRAPPHQGRQHPRRRRRRSSRSPSASPSCAPTRPSTTAATIVYEIMPFDPNVRTLDDVDRGRGGRRRAERRDRDRHLAHGQARHRARGAARASRSSTSPGSSSATGSARTWPTRSTRRSTTAACRARASSTSRLRRGLPRHGLPGAVGGRGPLRGAAQPAHGGDLQAGLRDDQRPVPAGVRDTREERDDARTAGRSIGTGSSGSSPRCCGSASSRSA